MSINIKDIFRICNINIVYHKNTFTISLNDIESNKAIKIISDENLEKDVEHNLFKCAHNYMNNTNDFPASIAMIGQFTEDENYIYWYVDNVCLFTFLNFKIFACYLSLDSINRSLNFSDKLTNKIIHITNSSNEFNQFIYQFIKDISNDKNSNYLKNGYNSIFISGDITEFTDKSIKVNYNQSLMFGDLDEIYYELFDIISEDV